MTTKKYVLGFAIWKNQISLIYKTKGPEYVIDTWNGIGGKIEAQDESLKHAMAREYYEETGLGLSINMWYHFATQRGVSWDGPDYELHCFVAHISDDFDASGIKNTEGDGEIVGWVPLEYIYNGMSRITPNLSWLIPLALDETTGFLEIKEGI